MGGGTRCLPGSRHACIYLISTFRSHGKNVFRDVFRPVRQSGIPVRSKGSRQKRDNFYHVNTPLINTDVFAPKLSENS